MRQAEVALRIDGIVVAPVRKRAARETHLEIITRFKHGVQRHVAPVAPSPYADAIRIEVRKRLEVLHAVALVRKLSCAHAEMQRRLKSVPAPRRTAIIQGKDNVALLRHELMPQEIGAAPGIAHNKNMGTA